MISPSASSPSPTTAQPAFLPGGCGTLRLGGCLSGGASGRCPSCAAEGRAAANVAAPASLRKLRRASSAERSGMRELLWLAGRAIRLLTACLAVAWRHLPEHLPYSDFRLAPRSSKLSHSWPH